MVRDATDDDRRTIEILVDACKIPVDAGAKIVVCEKRLAMLGRKHNVDVELYQ